MLTLDFSETRLLPNLTTPYLPSSSTSPACHTHMEGGVSIAWGGVTRNGQEHATWSLETLHTRTHDCRMALPTLQRAGDWPGHHCALRTQQSHVSTVVASRAAPPRLLSRGPHLVPQHQSPAAKTQQGRKRSGSNLRGAVSGCRQNTSAHPPARLPDTGNSAPSRSQSRTNCALVTRVQARPHTPPCCCPTRHGQGLACPSDLVLPTCG